MKNSIVLVIAITFLSTLAVAQKNVLLTSAEKFNHKGHVKSTKEGVYLDEFDKGGNQTASTKFNEDGSIKTITKYKYGKPGLLTERTTYDGSNKLIEKTIYEYDHNDYELKHTTYDTMEKIVYQEATKYTDNHHYITDIIISRPYETDTITTDANYNIIEKRITNYNSKIYYRKVFSYKPGMKKPYLEQHFNEKGIIFLEIQDDFDSNGNSIKHIEKGYGQTQITTYEYTYDAKGNYTKRIAKGQWPGTYERTIKYY